MRQPRGFGDVPHASSGEGGFALVVALLALVGLTALATAGFLTSNSEYRVNQNHRASVQAFYVAEAGLSEYLGHGRPDAIRTVEVSGGTAEIQAERVLELEDGNALVRVTSTGRHEPPEGGEAVRRVSAVALFNANLFQANAAITAAAGLEKKGVAGAVSGNDAAPPGQCPLAGFASLAGVAVPPGGYSQAGGGGGGGGPPGQGGGGPPGQGGGGGGDGETCPESPQGFEGDPPLDCTQDGLALLEATGLDWQAVLDGTAFPFDYVVSETGFPDFGLLPADDWPAIRIDQQSYLMNPTQSGRGTLVADGDLTFDGAVLWEGIVLVGGRITSSGTQTVRGTVITGLNLLRGESVEATSLGHGTWDYGYHSCAITSAMRAIGTLATQPGTWTEGF